MFWHAHAPIFEPYSRQYRSAIWVRTPEERTLAEQSMKARQEELGRPIHTAIETARPFWSAEDYHQKYRLRANPTLMDEMVERFPDGSWVDSTAAARLNGILGGHGYPGELQELGLSGRAERLVRKKLGDDR